MNDWWWLHAIFHFLQNDRYWPSQPHSARAPQSQAGKPPRQQTSASSAGGASSFRRWAALGTHRAPCKQQLLGHRCGQHGPSAGAVKWEEWQGDEFRRGRGGGETHVTKGLEMNGSEMRGKFTYALGEEERMLTSFLHDKCRQERGRKELLISGTNRYFFPLGRSRSR